MNLLLANSFTTFFNNLFANWQLVLFVVLITLLLLAIFFKRFKIVFIILMVAAALLAVALLVLLIISAIQWDLFAFIDFLIAWGPTVFFSLIVLLSTLINAKRGRRKSLILMIHAVAAAVVWVIFFVVATKSKVIDEGIVKLANLILGENGLQNMMNVSAEATSVRSILVLFVESLAGEGMFGILLHDTSAYIYTIADFAYHLAFAVICYICYLGTLVFLYFLYLCFYSERKYKRKKNKALAENKTDSVYKKHRIGGGIIGLVRGVVIGLMCMSFLGAGFYVVAGGRGEGKLKDYEASGTYEAPIRIYRSVESYGMQGIFLVLNAMSDPADMPYYLFAADLVFSGELNDEHTGLSENIYLTKELGALTGLARDTISLLLKYGLDDITGTVEGTSEGNLMESVLSVMKNEDFRQEFDLLIAQFNTPTYIYNFGMSLVSSVLANIDSMSFAESMSEQNRELIKIMFKEGHLSSYIPEDCELHDINESLHAEDPWVTTGRNVRPYLTVQQLVTKDDFRVFVNMFMTAISESGEDTDTLGLIRMLLPKIKELSIFESGNATAIDPVFARLYCFVQNAYLKAEGAKGYSYNALVKEDVKWTKEIVGLLDVAEDFFAIYDDVKEAESAIFNQILYIFDASNPNRERDTALFDAIEERISSSYLIGKTLASSLIQQMINDGLGQIFENIYIYENTVYETTLAEDGSVLKYGELHYLLKSLRVIGSLEDKEIFVLLFGEEEMELSTMLTTVSDVMKETDDDGNNFAHYASRSNLFRSVLSSFLIEGGEDVIYIPKTAREQTERGEAINVIKRDQLEGLLNSIGLFADFVLDCVEGDGGYFDHIDEYFNNDDFMKLIVENRIIEGSLAKLVKENFTDTLNTENVVIPKTLKNNLDSWCTDAVGKAGELRHFLDAYLLLRDRALKDAESTGGEGSTGYPLNLQTMMSGEASELFVQTIANLGESGEQFLRSQIIHYTISGYLFRMPINELTVVIPASARDSLTGEDIDYLIHKDELVIVLSLIQELNVQDNIKDKDGNEQDQTGKILMQKLISGRAKIKGDVLSASVVATLVDNGVFRDVLKLDEIYVDGTNTTYGAAGSTETLSDGIYAENPWHDELPRLLNALAVLFEEQMDEDNFDSFAFTEDTLKAAVLRVYNDEELMKTCRESKIIEARIRLLIPSGGEIPDWN